MLIYGRRDATGTFQPRETEGEEEKQPAAKAYQLKSNNGRRFSRPSQKCGKCGGIHAKQDIALHRVSSAWIVKNTTIFHLYAEVIETQLVQQILRVVNHGIWKKKHIRPVQHTTSTT